MASLKPSLGQFLALNPYTVDEFFLVYNHLCVQYSLPPAWAVHVEKALQDNQKPKITSPAREIVSGTFGDINAIPLSKPRPVVHQRPQPQNEGLQNTGPQNGGTKKIVVVHRNPVSDNPSCFRI